MLIIINNSINKNMYLNRIMNNNINHSNNKIIINKITNNNNLNNTNKVAKI